MQMDNVSSIATSKIGLGAMTSLAVLSQVQSSTIAGGLGNDTIVLDFTNAQSVVLLVIAMATSLLVATIPSGSTAPRSSLLTPFTVAAATIRSTSLLGWSYLHGLIVNANAGADKFDLGSGGVIDSTIGLGNQGDIFTASDSGQILSSRINLGKS